jgi:hypothetical protein
MIGDNRAVTLRDKAPFVAKRKPDPLTMPRLYNELKCAWLLHWEC